MEDKNKHTLINTNGTTEPNNSYTYMQPSSLECDEKEALNVKIEVKQEVSEFYCDICHEEFNSRLEMENHYNITLHSVNKIDDNEKLKFDEQQNNKTSDILVKQKKVIVKQCKMLYECEFCYKKFAHLKYFRDHIKIHTGKTPYECLICNKSFSQKGHLQIHRRTHTGETPYECEICDKKFSQNSYLKKHIKTHTGETPYGCEVCNKRFSQNVHLKKHILRWHAAKP